MVRLKTENHTGEKTYQHDDRYGLGADVVNLLNDAGYLFGPEDHDTSLAEKNGCGSHVIDPTDYFPAESSKGPGDKSAWLSSDFVFYSILIMRIGGHLPDSPRAWLVGLRYPNPPFLG
jgi:hypothetical protein